MCSQAPLSRPRVILLRPSQLFERLEATVSSPRTSPSGIAVNETISWLEASHEASIKAGVLGEQKGLDIVANPIMQKLCAGAGGALPGSGATSTSGLWHWHARWRQQSKYVFFHFVRIYKKTSLTVARLRALTSLSVLTHAVSSYLDFFLQHTKSCDGQTTQWNRHLLLRLPSVHFVCTITHILTHAQWRRRPPL